MHLEQMILIIIGIGLTMYVVFGGADFGAGIWEFNTLFQSSKRERDLLTRAMGPVWEANHVWLIFVLVLLFAAFPLAFAALSRALWLPLLLALIGIVFRGAGFAFRSSATGTVRQQEVWRVIFAMASIAAPLFLGAAFGAIASGRLAITATGDFTGNYFTDWLSGFSIVTAFLFVGMCTHISAVFLTREASQASDPVLTQLWRQRALTTGLWMGALAVAGIAMIKVETPTLWDGFYNRSRFLVFLFSHSGGLSLLFLWKNRFGVATIAASLAIASILVGCMVAQYPTLIPPAVTIYAAKAPDTVLKMMLWGILGGSILLIPSLCYLFYLFKSSKNSLGERS